MSALVIYRAGLPAAAPSLMVLLVALHNAIEYSTPALVLTKRSATAAERDLLDGRAAALRSALTPGTRDQIELVTRPLLRLFRPQSASEVAGMARAYAAVLDDLPLWAVTEAAGRFARGQVGGVHPDFAPTSARLHAIAAGLLAPVHLELTRIDRVLRAVTREAAAAGRLRAGRLPAVLDATAVDRGVPEPSEDGSQGALPF